MKKKVYITIPIFYASGDLHLGHAFSLVIGDTLSKYYKLINFESFLLVGLDEHGEKIFKLSQKLNVKPKDMVDLYYEKFKTLCLKLKINYSKFVRTTNPQHIEFVQKIFNNLFSKGLISSDIWNGKYCVQCEENYGPKIVKCNIGHQLIMKNEESLFLNMKNSEKLLNKDFYNKSLILSPNHYYSFLKSDFLDNLSDLSITRKFIPWGIKAPINDEYIIYVWFDALLSYISHDTCHLWNNKDVKKIHILGKDIIRFHAIYWPIILNYLNFEQPQKLLIHGWLLIDDKKMSKSLNNSVSINDLVNKFGLDVIRFFLIKLNWSIDNNFSIGDIYSVNNVYLSNLYGNIIFRFLGLIKKNNFTIPDIKDINFQINIDTKNFVENIKNENLPVLIENVFSLIREYNKIIDLNKPWEWDITDEKYKKLIVNLYIVICFIIFALSPIFVETTPKLCKYLNFDLSSFNIYSFNNLSLFINKKITPMTETIFKRYDDKEIQ